MEILLSKKAKVKYEKKNLPRINKTMSFKKSTN